MDPVILIKRHEEGSRVHVETANWFFLISVLLIASYSLIEAVNAFVHDGSAKRVTHRISNFVKYPVFLILLWTGMCAWGLFYHFKSDIIQIARRYGQLALATSTLTVFLAFKPSVFPYTHQVSMVSIHKWIGRTSILAALVHGVIYTISYMKAKKSQEHHTKRHGGHTHKLFSTFNVFGMISLAAFIIILVSSLGPARRRVYYLFYALHRPLVILIYVLMIWHARPSSNVLVVTTLLMVAVQIVIRLFSVKTTTISKAETFGHNLKLITFDPPVPKSQYTGCASHIRLSPRFINPSVFFKPSHPYTLIGQNQLIIRESRTKIFEGQNLNLYGPFSSSFDPEGYTHLLVFAGGSGVSLLPSLNEVVKHQMFVWVTRQSQETSITSPLGLSDLHIYVTGSRHERSSRDRNLAADQFELQEFEINSDDNDSIHDEEEYDLNVAPNIKSGSEGGTRISKGRPNFDEVLESFYGKTVDENARLCVVSCGPQELVDAVSNWASARNIDSWSETFSL